MIPMRKECAIKKIEKYRKIRKRKRKMTKMTKKKRKESPKSSGHQRDRRKEKQKNTKRPICHIGHGADIVCAEEEEISSTGPKGKKKKARPCQE